MSHKRGKRSEYAIATEGLAHDEQQRLCGVVLGILQPDADRVETDVPFQDSWPTDVRDSADRLMALPSSRRNGSYGQTGVVSLAAHGVWEDFAVVARWAYNASVWSAGSERLASLADESQSIVVRASAAQRAELGTQVGPDRIRRRVRRGLRSVWEPDQ